MIRVKYSREDPMWGQGGSSPQEESEKYQSWLLEGVGLLVGK